MATSVGYGYGPDLFEIWTVQISIQEVVIVYFKYLKQTNTLFKVFQIALIVNNVE